MRRRGAAALLALAFFFCAGCDELPGLSQAPGKVGFAPHGAVVAQDKMEAGFRAQLGLLDGRLSAQERAALSEIWEKLWPMRQDRLSQGVWAWSDYEGRLTARLRKLLDAYTVTHLDGDEGGFGYEDPPYQELAQFSVTGGETLTLRGEIDGAWTEEELRALWESVGAILPNGAFERFGRFELFTDGPEESLAYVYPMDALGKRWVLAVDPADAGDEEYFTETVLHEYCHYLTLNDTQVTYTPHQTTDTYNENGMVSLPGSYIDDFYQAFWPDYIDDCLAGADTYNFFLRHYDDFVDPYASTDPSEDICESFTFFVLYERMDGRDVWERKLDSFYRYPELVAFRAEVRERLGLEDAA